MLPRDLCWRDYNVLRREGRLVHGSSEDSCRSFHPRGVEYRLLPLVQVKPDFAVPYVLCWRVLGAIHRVQLPFQHHHRHHYYHLRRQRRRQFQGNHRRHPVPFATRYSSPYACSLQRGGLLAVPEYSGGLCYPFIIAASFGEAFEDFSLVIKVLYLTTAVQLWGLNLGVLGQAPWVTYLSLICWVNDTKKYSFEYLALDDNVIRYS
ncbi:uncharacterized protein LOC143178520 [Calliopsis andreniformis]|uniref:uncharacterized protein LOC143178520 n=1 Tax=Calliopsis andreniformis TaxID=337506 RepID=UPI003FCDFBF9